MKVLKDECIDDLDMSHPTQSSESPQVALFIPKSASTEPKVTLVDDVCAAVEVARSRNQQAAFLLTRNGQIGMIHSDQETSIPYPRNNKITLKTLLLPDNKSGHRDSIIPLKSQMLLALRLSSNLLQLLRT